MLQFFFGRGVGKVKLYKKFWSKEKIHLTAVVNYMVFVEGEKKVK